MGAFTQVLTADGNTSEFTLNGEFQYRATGTFGGGTVTLEVKTPAGNWVSLSDTELTADGVKDVTMRGSNRLRGALSGATSPNIEFYIGSEGVIAS